MRKNRPVTFHGWSFSTMSVYLRLFSTLIIASRGRGNPVYIASICVDRNVFFWIASSLRFLQRRNCDICGITWTVTFIVLLSVVA